MRGRLLILLLAVLATLTFSADESLRGGGRKNRNKEASDTKKRNRPDPRRPKKIRKERIDSSITRALTINYPLHIFASNAPEWRTKASYNKKIVEETEETKNWVEYARAQDQEDIYLYETYFYGMTGGLVIESGALDGELFSNSHLLEHFANWSAILVEADPENYSNLKNNRPRAVNVHGALCSESRLLHYSSEGVIPVRGFIEFMTPSFIKQWHGRVYNNRTKISDLPTVQCLPMKILLRELNVNHVDLWILDVIYFIIFFKYLQNLTLFYRE